MASGNLLKTTDVISERNVLDMKINLTYPRENTGVRCELISSEYIINELVTFKIKTECSYSLIQGNAWGKIFKVYIQLQKNDLNKDNSYDVEFTSPELHIIRSSFYPNNGEWIEIYLTQNNWSLTSFRVLVKLNKTPTSFEYLYDDLNLADFELKGEDGSVQVHKSVLAAHSPVLHRMVTGEWRETKEGHVKIPNTTLSTLQHFKNYMYQRVLPDTDLKQLVLLGSCYMMPDLQRRASNKLAQNLTAQRATDLLQFAFVNKIVELQLAVLYSIQNGLIKVIDMEGFMVPPYEEESEKL